MTASYSFKEGESAVDNPDLIPSAELAYLGDSVIEVLVRERLVLTPSPQASSKRSLAFVTAVAQSKALDNIIPMFTEEESDVFRRGRNCVHSGIPKSASAAEYRRAPGMECVFGYLWLKGEHERLRALFDQAYRDLEE